MPFVVTVDFRIRPGQMDAFLPIMRDNAAASVRDEPGCLQFDVCTDPARLDQVFLYEVYTDAAAFDAHLATPHFADFNAASADMIADKTVHSFAAVARHPH